MYSLKFRKIRRDFIETHDPEGSCQVGCGKDVSSYGIFNNKWLRFILSVVFGTLLLKDGVAGWRERVDWKQSL